MADLRQRGGPRDDDLQVLPTALAAGVPLSTNSCKKPGLGAGVKEGGLIRLVSEAATVFWCTFWYRRFCLEPTCPGGGRSAKALRDAK